MDSLVKLLLRHIKGCKLGLTSVYYVYNPRRFISGDRKKLSLRVVSLLP